MPQIAPWVKTLCSYSATSDAEGVRGEPLGEDRVRGPVALEDAVRDELLGRALRADLLGGLAEGERLGLREDVGDQQVVVLAERVERAA